MPYTHDDSCPKCGEVSYDGRTHQVCPTTCPECETISDQEDGCYQCIVNEQEQSSLIEGEI